MVVVLDGSASIHSSDWQKALTFTNKVVDGFNISSDQVNLAVVQFSEVADTVIGLTDDAAAIKSAVSSLAQMRLGTNTYSGFKQAKEILDTQGRHTAQAVILMTDGMQNAGLPASIEANKLKAEANTTVFGIGVGPHVKKAEIEDWVSAPPADHYFAVTGFSALETILKKLLAASCPPPPIRRILA